MLQKPEGFGSGARQIEIAPDKSGDSIDVMDTEAGQIDVEGRIAGDRYQ